MKEDTKTELVLKNQSAGSIRSEGNDNLNLNLNPTYAHTDYSTYQYVSGGFPCGVFPHNTSGYVSYRPQTRQDMRSGKVRPMHPSIYPSTLLVVASHPYPSTHSGESGRFLCGVFPHNISGYVSYRP